MRLGVKDQRVVDAFLRALGDANGDVRQFTAVALLKLLFLHQQVLGQLANQYPKETGSRSAGIVQHLLETATAGDLQPVFDTPHAVPMIIQGLLDEASPDSIYYSLLFFRIGKLRPAIARELLPALSDPDQDERTKQVIFRLLMRVELIAENET